MPPSLPKLNAEDANQNPQPVVAEIKLAAKIKPKGSTKRRHQVLLREVLTRTSIHRAFKSQTWAALRRQPCRDLFGYYDYNLQIGAQAEHLVRSVLGGSYQRQPPIQIELTKSDLLVRRMQLPHPDEAVLMTAITNYLEPLIKAVQPSQKAYYGRSDTQQRGIHLLKQTQVYPWLKLWSRYQTDLLEFSRKRRLVVTTDIQNFFDSVSLGTLRNRLTAVCGLSDELPNFIIFLFENFAVRDRYAPFRNVGIPTIDSDLPRIAAHCLLFELDHFLRTETANSYSRWVDDINFGVSDRTEARSLIRRIERLLFRQGLRIGGGKTEVLDRDGVNEYIQQEENQFLNVTIGNDTDQRRKRKIDGEALASRFAAYRIGGNFRHKEKVIRRYYNAFATRADKGFTLTAPSLAKLFKASKDDFDQHPDSRFRVSIVNFWLSLPATTPRLRRLLKVVRDGAEHDDVVVAATLQGLAETRLTPAKGRFVVDELGKMEISRPGLFYGVATLLAKHGTRAEIAEFVSRSYTFWSGHELFTRQIVALWCLLPDCAEKAFIQQRLRNGKGPSVDQLFRFVRALETVKSLTPSLRKFLPPGLESPRFDLYRALVANLILRSAELSKDDRRLVVDGIAAKVKDPTMRLIALGRAAR